MKTFFLILCGAVVFDIWLWYRIAVGSPVARDEIFFFDVGQGDAELLRSGGLKMLTDAGPDKTIVDRLERYLGWESNYIDIVLLTHPQADHFGGLRYILKRKNVGTVLMNGRNADTGRAQWDELLGILKERHIPVIGVGTGDAVRIGDASIRFLSPDMDHLASGELNDTGVVARIRTSSFSALLTADIDMHTENELISLGDIRADILKVAHHGSKFSSGQKFLAAVNPRIAVIEVGKGNTYGHPSVEALNRMRVLSGLRVFRTDQDKTIRITSNGSSLSVFSLP